jgi:nucleotide-binding universal stress UspA family protein
MRAGRDATPQDRRPPVIVAGVDECQASRAALVVARRLASRLQGKLVVAHAVPPTPRHPYALGANAERLRAEVEAVGHDAVSRIVERAGCSAPDGIAIGAGEPTDFLTRVANEWDAMLVVVGARARGPATRAVLGSVSCSLAAASRRPVVIVPARCDDRVLTAADDPDTNVLCGVDGSNHSANAVSVAGDLAQRLGARLVLAHAWQAPAPQELAGAARALPETLHYDELSAPERQSSLRLVHRMLAHAAAAPAVDARLAEGPAPEALNELARDADLVVVGSRGRGPLRSAVLGSTSAFLAVHGDRPVVVTPAAGT